MLAAESAIPAARRNRHLIFALLSTSLLTVIMQFTMVSVSLKQLTTDLNAPLRWSGWVLTTFTLGQVIAQPVAGRLTQRLGARFVFAGGLAAFGAASIVCAAAPNVYIMIVARLVQGIAGGGIIPAGSAIIGEVYGEEGRARAIGFFASLIPFGSVLGPTVGGFIVDTLGWRWTFGINGPLAILACAAGFAILPAGRKVAAQHIDFAGVVLIACAVAPLIFALTELGQKDTTPNIVLIGGATLLGILAIGVLVWHERRIELPVVDLDLITGRGFLAANTLSFFFGLAWSTVTSLLPLYAQEAYGFSASEAGTLLAPRSVAMIAASTGASWFLLRTGYRRPLVVGLIGTALLIILLARGIHEPSIAGTVIGSFWWLMVVVTILGVFFGIANPSMNNAAIDLAPDRIAAVTGLRAMAQGLGSTFGISFALLLASRAATQGGGLEMAFTTFAVLLIVATAALIFYVPEMSRHRRVVVVDGDIEEAPLPAAGD
jgi:EmrB/QacA subfamily drug resistance transporter